jgi:drug/metabolite transporter (DMT)-like permease
MVCNPTPHDTAHSCRSAVSQVPSQTSTRVTLVICLGLTWILWGSTFLAIKIALPGFPPFFQMGTRFVCAGALLLAWLRVVRGESLPSARQWSNAVIIGGLLLAGGAGGTAHAQRTVASGLAAAFIAVEPALMLCGHWAFGRRPASRELLGILLGLVGVLLLVRGSGFAGSAAGLVAISIAAVSWSVGSVLEVQWLHTARGLMGAASQMICGGSLLLILSAIQHEPLHWPTLSSTLAWLYLVIFGSLFAFSAFATLLRTTRTSVAMSYTFVNPVVAAWLGVTLAGESLTSSELGAMALILASVGLLLVGRKSP